MAPQKGKTGTKGQKQILEENKATLNFYRNMIIAVSAVYIVFNLVFGNVFSLTNIFLYALVIASHGGSYKFMAYMSIPKHSESGQLLDAGTDLNMEGGLAEYTKDLIILTSGCQLLSIISNYFWFLWLLILDNLTVAALPILKTFLNTVTLREIEEGLQELSLFKIFLVSKWLSSLAPGQAFWILWKNFLGPYFMQQSPGEESPEVNEKKQKKLERRKKRQQNVRY